MSHSKTKPSRCAISWLGFGAFSLPFIVTLLVVSYLVPEGWFCARTDAPTFLFGTGLNWLAFAPQTFWHMPGYFWSIVSAPLVAMFGFQSDSLIPFQTAGLVLQYGVVIGCAFYVARGCQLFPKLLPTGAIVLVAIIAATFPTTLAYARIWGHNYPNCAILAAAAVGLWIATRRRRSGSAWERVGPMLAGFCGANFFTTIALALVWCVVKWPGNCWRNQRGRRLRVSWGMLLAFLPALFAVWSFLRGALIFGGNTTGLLPHSKLLWVLANPGLGFGIMVVVALLWRQGWLGRRGLPTYLKDVIMPLGWGWLLGCGPAFFDWGSSLFYAWQSKGGSPSIPLWHLFEPATLVWVGERWCWLGLIIIPFLAGVWGVTRRCGTTRVAGWSCLLLLGISLLGTGGCLAALRDGSHLTVGHWGIDLRLGMTWIALVGLGTLFLYCASGVKSRLFVTALILFCAGLSLGQFIHDHREYVREVRQMESALDNVTQKHLQKNSAGRILLAGPVEHGEIATALTSWQVYLTTKARQRFPRVSSIDGHWLYISDWKSAVQQTVSGQDAILLEATTLPTDIPENAQAQKIVDGLWWIQL